MKIAYIMKSEGLEYDDRIRKEMFSIKEVLKEVEVKIFAFDGRDNHSGEGVLSYGVPYEFISVRHRGGKRKDIISMILKEYDFYKQVKERVKGYDILWCCDAQPFFFPLFSKKLVIWDLHEIPALVIGSRLKNWLFHRMERRSRWLIHANQERIDYLVSKNVLKLPKKNLILRNFPDHAWLEEGGQEPESFKSFKHWLGEDEYVYIQGINSPARHPLETLSAIMESKAIKAVVIGRVSEDIKEKIRTKYPQADSFIYYTGQLVQSETSSFISNCKFSIVFYDMKTPNNRYCEPNRMFQCLAFGKPVIVGCNDSMASVINKYCNGIVLNSDGSNLSDNICGINKLLSNFGVYEKAAQNTKEQFSWESQIQVFKRIFIPDMND